MTNGGSQRDATKSADGTLGTWGGEEGTEQQDSGGVCRVNLA